MPATYSQQDPSHGAMSRPLGNLEAFFKSLSEIGKPLNREHWTVHLALRLSFSPSVAADPAPYLRRAWQLLRFQHPTLGACLREPEPGINTNRASLVVGPLDLEKWADDTFAERHDFADADELFSSLYSTPTATCYWLPRSSELVIRSSHWRIDGVGMVLLGNEFMTTVAKVMKAGQAMPLKQLLSREFESGPVLPPSLEDLVTAQSSYEQSDDLEEDPVLAAGADDMVGTFLRGFPSIGLPTREPPSPSILPGSSDRAVSRLGVETTTRFLAACKEKGIKVTSAVHAAIIRVTASFPQHPLAKSYAVFAAVNLRSALEATATPETKDISTVVGVYFSGLPICVESVSSRSFVDIAQDLANSYGKDVLNYWQPPASLLKNGSAAGRDGRAIGLLDLARPYVRRTTALFNAPVPEGLPPVQSPDLSSLGMIHSSIQREYGDKEDGNDANVQVADVWLGTEMLTRSVQFHVWSWEGTLRIGACFNKSFYDKKFVEQALGMVVEDLISKDTTQRPVQRPGGIDHSRYNYPPNYLSRYCNNKFSIVHGVTCTMKM
ncbi:hypothetical protein GGR50DRAFT_649209 [Xylaria sp. CBS 124048]|nr:hypothetical protein GGR50DRAFT_649209 [Xylaria sp. CBS 124048]